MKVKITLTFTIKSLPKIYKIISTYVRIRAGLFTGETSEPAGIT